MIVASALYVVADETDNGVMVKSESAFVRTIRSAFEGVLGNLLYALIVVLFVTYLSRITSIWSRIASIWQKPLMNGLMAGFLVIGIIFLSKTISRLPKKYDPTTVDNIESRVRMWLDNFHLGVKNSPLNDTHFHFIVTTDGGKNIGIARSIKEWPDYLQFLIGITPTEEEKAMVATFSDKEKARISIAMKLELSRQHMGYNNFSLDGFVFFKRIPISSDLSESMFIDTLWEMEAMVNAIFMIAARGSLEHEEVAQAVLSDDRIS